MSTDWSGIILDSESPQDAWAEIFSALQLLSRSSSSPVALHDATVIPDRLLTEAAWELWEAFPMHAEKTSDNLKGWAVGSGKAVLILDALSLRELPILMGAAEARGIQPVQVKVTGSECPSTTDHFAKSLGLPSRSALANDGKPGTFALFGGNCYTDVVSLPFEDCAVPPSPNMVIWHSWLDDLIHLQNKLPDQIAGIATSTLQSDGFWNFVNRLRQGRGLIVTSDHGYAVSKRFSSEVEDPDAIEILRKTFGASRNKAVSEPWQKRFMPPIVMTNNNQHVVMGQRKWKVQGGFPHVCHGGMSLLEVTVPYMEFPAL
ncbi:hypothetical protein [Nitratidesulfovibrio sp. SRB-5]|uniref:hypothetical protein n=1 Tax=Nitratidesulfovibrio sp. SRB-5 TaxID=2872636 RepID=UPI001027DB4D|nr:hypothetical protein [Nitratidesulfovibrio sp. SRB-5]MBZ2173419.1 hypothetical protein [Nitratidesulfovibrio sp. SRB-5]RXF77180.1 hypothetical protein EKK70_08025 [Desulfovibrio sp. DS-1]